MCSEPPRAIWWGTAGPRVVPPDWVKQLLPKYTKAALDPWSKQQLFSVEAGEVAAAYARDELGPVWFLFMCKSSYCQSQHEPGLCFTECVHSV